MTIEKHCINRLAPSETFVDAMPESDAGLAQLPAKVNFFALEQSREVDEPGIQLLHQATELMNSLDGLLKSYRSLLPEVLFLCHLDTVHPHTSHNGQPLGEAVPLGFGPLVLGLQRDHLTNGRRQARKHFFSF